MDLRTFLSQITSQQEERINKGLRSFIDSCSEYRKSNKSTDSVPPLVVEYIKSSPKCQELFDIWEDFHGDYQKTCLLSLFEVFAEFIRYTDEQTKRDLCITILRKRKDDLAGALLSNNADSVNSTCILLRSISFVGAAAVQLVNQRIPIDSLQNLPNLIRSRKTRYRTSSWICAVIREDPQVVGKQVLLHPDIISALLSNMHRDGTYLQRELITSFSNNILSSPLLSIKMKRDFFSLEVLRSLIEACRENESNTQLHSFVLQLFSSSPICLYDRLSVFSFSSHVPTMVFRVLSDLNPFKNTFDCTLYLAILRTHPEVLPLLFSEPQTNLSGVSDAVEKSQSKVLVHWLLEPRESAVWYGTVDFLIQVLRMPLALPSETHSLSAEGESFFETIHPWLFPVAISRSLLSKGLVSSVAAVVLKTVELVQALMERLEIVGFWIYGSAEKAELFMKHFVTLLPAMDGLLSLFRRVTMCLVNRQPLEGKKVKAAKDTALANMQIGGLQMEEEEEGEEDPMPGLEKMMGSIVTLLLQYIRLFPSEIDHLHTDVLSLFSRVNDSVLLFTLPKSLTLSLLSFISAICPTLGNSLIVGKGAIHPMHSLLAAALSGRCDETVMEAIEDMLVVVLKEVGALSGISFMKSFIHFVVHLLTPGMIPFFVDVIQDLTKQQLLFLTRNHTFNEDTPLFYHALLYAALKPKTVGLPLHWMWISQLLVLTNPQLAPSISSLSKRFIDESKNFNMGDRKRLLIAPMSDGMAQSLEWFIRWLSKDYSVVSPPSLIDIDVDAVSASLKQNWDNEAMALFMKAMTGSFSHDAVESLIEDDPLLRVALALAGCVVEGESPVDSIRLLEENSEEAVEEILLILLAYMNDHSWVASQIEETISSQAAIALISSSLFCESSLVQKWLSCVSNADFAELLRLILRDEYLSFWTSSATAASAFLSHFFSLPAEAAVHQLDRSLAEIFLHHLETPLAIQSLTLLQGVLFAEEKIAVVSFILHHAQDPIIDQQLQKAGKRWVVPLDHQLLSDLFASLAETPLAARLLYDALHQLLDQYSEEAVRLIPNQVLNDCWLHFDNVDYQLLMRLVLQLQPAFHVPFIQSLNIASQQPFYKDHLAGVAELVTVCLSHASSLMSSLEALQNTSFLNDLLLSLAAPDVADVQFTCLRQLAEQPVCQPIFASLDLPTLFKQALQTQVLQTERLHALLATASLASEQDRVVSILLLRCLQAIGKSCSQLDASQHFVPEGFLDLFLEACDTYALSLQQLLSKQPDLYARLVRILLRNRLNDAEALAVLRVLISAAAAAQLTVPEASPGHLLSLLQSHSLFDQVIKQVAEEVVFHSDAEIRQRWIRFDSASVHQSFSYRFLALLTHLIELSPRDCSPTLFTRLLSLYNCSLSPQDRLIRSAFQSLHTSQVFNLEDVGYLFGSFAPQGTAESIQTPSTWLLEAVSGLRLRKSVEHFPRELKAVKEEEGKMEVEEKMIEWNEEEDEEEEEERNRLELQEEQKVPRRNSVDIMNPSVETESFDPTLDCVESLLASPPSFSFDNRDCVMVVDPSFYLPLLHYYLQLGEVNVQAYLSHGVAGYLIACLTSENVVIRQTASCLLQRFVELISDASFFEKKQISMLFLKFQNSITNPAMCLPSIEASFIHESISILQRPENSLYSVVNRFWCNRPTFSLFDTPLFESLFLTDDENYKQLRAWCMRYLLRGIQTEQDYAILSRRHVITQLQTLALSSRTDAYLQRVVIATLQRLVSIPEVIEKMVVNVGILPWMEMMMDRAKQRMVVYGMVEILVKVVESGLIERLNVWLNSLNLIGRLMVEFSKGAENEYEADVNRIFIPCLRMFSLLCEQRTKSPQLTLLSETTHPTHEINRVLVVLWRECVTAMMHLHTLHQQAQEKFILEGGELSNDDFYLICSPSLKSLADCFSEGCRYIRTAKSLLPASVESDSECEGMLEHLLFYSVCYVQRRGGF